MGAGLIGQSWAALFASKGYRAIIQDAHENAIERGLEGINSILVTLKDKGMIGKRSAALARKLVQMTSLSEAVEDVEYVQESVYEDYKVKRRVFRDMDRLAPW